MQQICLLVIWLSFCQLVHPQQCRQQVTTVCDEHPTSPFKGEKGDVGSPGKAGVAGMKGGKGEVGRIGQKGNKGDSSTVEAFEAEIRPKLQGLLQCSGGVVVGRVCYRLPYRVGSRLNFEDAEALCAFQSGQLAEIPTEEAYNAVYEYVKITWSHDLGYPTFRHIGIWFGMQYQGGSVILRNGSPGFVSWQSGYPRGSGTKMGMRVQIRSQDSPLEGMWNLPPSHTAIPLCQFKLD